MDLLFIFVLASWTRISAKHVAHTHRKTREHKHTDLMTILGCKTSHKKRVPEEYYFVGCDFMYFSGK
jgi:hypothetical protein